MPFLSTPLRCTGLLTLAATFALMAGCAGPGSEPRLQAPSMPSAWATRPPQGAAEPELRAWWKAFHSPALDAMVDEALANNLDVAVAIHRLRMARLQSGRAAVQFRPSFNAEARTLQDIAAADSYFHASIDMVWELGLFGAGDSIRSAANADANAALADSQGVRVAVVADVVRNYLDLQAAQRQLQLLDTLERIDKRAATLADIRRRTLIGSADEMLQVRMQTAQTRAARAAPQEALARAAQNLSLLLGRSEPDPAWSQSLAEMHVTLPVSLAMSALPADLLRTRPDVQAAEAAVLKAAAGVGLAQSELYPRIAIMGSLLYSYNITRNLRTRSDSIPAVGPVIDIPLFDWGRRRLQVDAEKLALESAVLEHQRTVRAAVVEAEGALAALAAQQERANALEAVRTTWQERSRTANTRMRLGLSGEFDTLATQRAVVQAEAEQATAQDAQALAFVALYKALGGAPLPPDEAAAPTARSLSGGGS